MDGRRAHTPVVREREPGRNDPCPCGSGRKYGNCHGRSKYSDDGDGKVK